MSKPSHRKDLAQNTAPGWQRWLAPALIALTGVAILSGLLWLVQNDRAASVQSTPAQNAATQPAYAGGPRVSVDQEIFDYDDVKFGTPVKTVIKIKNVGDAPLVLEREPWVELIEGC